MAQVPSKSRLKGIFSKGKFDDEFVTIAKIELPYIFGRLALLEELYSIQMRGGDPDRTQQLHQQLGTPKEFHGSPLRKLIHAFTG
jgi:hypothetical protein